jgi:hypothetical protein
MWVYFTHSQDLVKEETLPIPGCPLQVKENMDKGMFLPISRKRPLRLH